MDDDWRVAQARYELTLADRAGNHAQIARCTSALIQLLGEERP